VVTALDELTEGCELPYDVARKLGGLRISGWRGQPTCCPLANYLRRTVEGWDGMVVRRRVLMTRSDLAADDFVELPDVLFWFVLRFDNGGFSNLEAPRKGC
jgi:hypothetical protein